MKTFQGNHSLARTDSSPTFSYSMCRKGPSMKLLDKEKWEWMRIGSVILPPHLFLISFSYQVVLICYLLCLSVSLIWKCSFFRVGRPQLISRKIIGVWTYGKSGRNFARRQETSVCYFYPCLCVCVCVEVRMNIHVMRISAGGHACLYSSCLDCLFWHTHCLCGASTAACGTVLGTRSENKTSLKILPYAFSFPDNIFNPEFTLWHYQFLLHNWGNVLHPNLKHLRWREEGTGTVIKCCLSHLPSFAFPHVSVLAWVSTTYGQLGPHWISVTGPWFKLKRLERALRFD